MRLREKTTATLLIAIFITSIFVMPVSAKGWGKPETMVRVIGHFTTNYDYLGSGTDHRCFVNLHARQVADGWTGHGIFRDRDYEDGKLFAIFTVESAGYEDLPRQINYKGTADVYVNEDFIGNYAWATLTAIGAPIEVFSFQIPGLGYYAFLFGEDIELKMTVK